MTTKNYFKSIIEGRRNDADASFWKPLLSLASRLYRTAVEARKSFYDKKVFKSKALQIPVISIGNITWGGVGKTPLTQYISRFYLDQKKTPLILTRGYGNDETREFQTKVPEALLGVGKNRFEVASQLLKSQKADAAILDDGFQHYQLARDLDIVVINVLNPFGNEKLIPRGILREPLEALDRANIVVFNDVNLISRKSFESIRDRVKQLAPRAELIEAQHEPLYFYWAKSKARMDLNKVSGKPVTTFSGVGTPRSFQLLLNSLGVKTVRNFEFCDHHPFSEKELQEIQEVKRSSQSEFVITTEKDLLRKEELITNILDPLVLKISMRITVGESILQDRLRHILR